MTVGEGRHEASRHGDVRCRQCNALLALLNRPSRRLVPEGADPLTARIVTVEPGVRLFVDVLFRQIELHCPACGACGRTIGREKLRGVVQIGADPAA